MAGSRTEVLNLRIAPGVKEGLRVAAEREHRSLANMVEWLILQYCEKAGISITQQTVLSLDDEDEHGRKSP